MDTTPRVGDSTNLLLAKLVEATNALVALGGVKDAPNDGNSYIRVNGTWVKYDPVIDGIVMTHDQLPVTVGTPAIDSAYLVINPSGVYFVNRFPAGIYVRTANNGNLNDWQYAADLTNSEA